jgi:PKD repeat protein
MDCELKWCSDYSRSDGEKEMASGWFNKGKMMRLGLISIMLVCVISGMVSAAVSLTGPATVTRGGVSNGEPNVDGYFNLNIVGNSSYDAPMHLGLIINPQTMTGDICDRPPYLNASYDSNNTTLGNDAMVWPADIANSFSFSQVVPNGVDAPSVGCWDVPWNGTRYYGQILTNNTTVSVNTLYPDISGSNEFLATSLKPGVYTYHLQTDNLTRSLPGVDSVDYSVTVNYGLLSAGAYNLTAWKKDGTLLPVSSIQAGQTVLLLGTNTDSQTTHLWIGGTDLPECGRSLTTLTVNSTPGSIEGAYLNGTWFYQWTAPCISGTYTIYASSIDPSDVVSRMCNNIDGGSCVIGPCGQGGICGLINCPTCAPAPATVTITVTEPEFQFTLPEIVDRCCCEVFPCGSADSMTSFNLSGYSGAPGLPIQVWLFGDDWIGERRYLIGTYTSSVDTNGSFFLDIRKLLSDEGINFCDLKAGDYHLIVQIPGCGSTAFDVGPEYIPTGLFGRQALKALLTKLNDDSIPLCLNCPRVTDRHIWLPFKIRDVCNGGSVDFTAYPMYGYAPLTVQFNDTSTFAGSSRIWDFGDNYTSTDLNPSHTYASPGIYTVSETVTNGTDTKEQTKHEFIFVEAIPSEYYPPFANFTYSVTYAKTGMVQFIDQSSGSTPLSYLWDFGDNTSVNTSVSPLHQYSTLGEYNVTLTVKDAFNMTSSITMPVSVQLPDAPVAYFSYSLVDDGTNRTVQFVDESSNTPVSWFWYFGENYTSTEVNPLYTYQLFGSYQVSLTVSNAGGTSSYVQNITLPTPEEGIVAGFDVVETGTRTFEFSNNSTGPVLMWELDFRDGTTESWYNSTGGWPKSHTYNRPGNYPVTLNARNNLTYSNTTEPQWVFVL